MFPLKLALIIGAIVLGGAILLLCTYQYLVTSTGAYKEAIRLLHSSTEARALLGDDIKTSVPALGFVNASNGANFVVFSAPVAGSRGRAQLYGVANAVNGIWEFSLYPSMLTGSAI